MRIWLADAARCDGCGSVRRGSIGEGPSRRSASVVDGGRAGAQHRALRRPRGVRARFAGLRARLAHARVLASLAPVPAPLAAARCSTDADRRDRGRSPRRRSIGEGPSRRSAPVVDGGRAGAQHRALRRPRGVRARFAALRARASPPRARIAAPLPASLAAVPGSLTPACPLRSRSRARFAHVRAHRLLLRAARRMRIAATEVDRRDGGRWARVRRVDLRPSRGAARVEGGGWVGA